VILFNSGNQKLPISKWVLLGGLTGGRFYGLLYGINYNSLLWFLAAGVKD
jgi:hypothetical protein